MVSGRGRYQKDSEKWYAEVDIPNKEDSPPTDYDPSEDSADTKMIRSVLVGGTLALMRNSVALSSGSQGW